MKNTKKEIVVCVTAGISAYKACEVVRNLKNQGHLVSVLMTKDAVNFIGPLTFKTLSGRPVVVDMFAEDVPWDPCHISLAERADLVVVVPATANIIAKLAAGICDDIITCVITATKAKTVICPAMNDNMYKHPATQANLKKIREFGYKIIEPVKGKLACGTYGIGHIAPVEAIISGIKKLIG
ncbi:MAG: flavoprotein [Candidatus Omnitrophota bacterium]